MSRVLLIKAMRKAVLETGDSVAPPLGLLCLAAYANKVRPGKDQFTILDERIHPKTQKEWIAYIEELRPDCIGVSAMSADAGRVDALIPFLKKNFPNIPVVLGGPLASSAGPDLIKHIPADYLVMGEGEKAFVSLLEMFEQGLSHPGREISGLAFSDPDGKTVCRPKNKDLIDIKSMPFPAYDLIDLMEYQHQPRMTPMSTKEPYAYIMTSRGCPYHCIYCHDIFSKKFRPMDALQVVDEIERLITDFGIHEFEIIDDVFNLNKKRVLKICSEIKRRGLKTAFTFPNGLRSDILDREVLEALASVGTYHIDIAVESASPRIQKLAKKNINLEKLEENAAIASELGIFCWGFFMLGFPTETRREILKTLFWAWRSPMHGAFFFIVIPQEGTELAREYCSKTPGGPKAGSSLYFNVKDSLAHVGATELRMYQSLAYLLFLCSPRRLWAIYRHVSKNGGRISGTLFRFLDYLFLHKLKSLAKQVWGAAAARFGQGAGQKI
ncbi:Radical SAM superfamily enzyme YgiQ, UPF0313 family [Desulfatibacillum alkenivorans DSM 16219]|jgi:radical SAM superfamily enzyme YgiQ (UPF0313 family)|uniref:Radical SAM superfamily enzyme YgiQ, UPF0313 family n=1 Tax=Desulfatibacillum alkenivorans DSM 16219 TaxID=1121393 RepID=A0A1M6NJQ4_9BACT|nr:radical SAM protein [Desulfatibacillum alkenivorans]SHJ95910.1 Radical SAM superfamily enzyme YgiQ, UPF0313 family [Desulfatibacillum alkenivorans DSM 16219]